MRRVMTLIGLGLVVGAATPLLAGEPLFTLLVKGNLTTQTQIYINPNSPDPIARSESINIKDFTGFGAELQYHLPTYNLAFAFSVERISVSTPRPILISFQRSIPGDDGYEVIPVELTGYFIIPASGESVKVYMGGGIGAYFGRRVYRIAGVEASATDATPGFGIHVLGGVGYRFTDWLSLSAEMKFRDLQFETINAFNVSRIPVGDTFLNVTQTPFASRVHTDGIVFQLSVGLSL